jgi:formylmethanofuran dehydrogenase subunit A
MTTLRIAGGRVIDPANGVNDKTRDVWVCDGRVIKSPTDPAVKADRTIDARGFVVMPGGVDMHCHIAGPKVNAARALRPEDARQSGGVNRTAFTRSGTGSRVPSTFVTGYRYAGLGYTTAIDAAVPALGARQAHHELRDTPVIDKGHLVLMGNNHFVMEQIKAADRGRLHSYVAWLLSATKAYGVKAVNPGGIESWKQGRGTLHAIDDEVPSFGVTPRQILEELAGAVDALDLPHPLHLHTLNLGVPGNAATTLETMRALDGHRAHLAHIQFHSYGGQPDDAGHFDSQVEALADYVNTHANITVDVGQVLFGETTSLTADSAVGQLLHSISGRKWVSHDLELETGCGVVPIEYHDTNFVHALQWAIGLEWYLRVTDPWRVAMSTDHPNGGSFLAYPQIIALLMDSGRRSEVLGRLPPRVRARSGLADLTREYSLAEIAIITRAGPARILGLTQKGHLGPGADADLTIYNPDIDKERMFSCPRYVIKAGTVVVEDGELRTSPQGKTLYMAPPYDTNLSADLKAWFSRYSSIQFANYAVREEDLICS